MTDTTEATSPAASDPNQKVWPQSPWVPYDERVVLYSLEHWEFGGVAQAWEYTGWRDETLSWKKTAYIHGHLNPSPTARISGPDALEFLQGVCVNSFQAFQVGAARHAVMTDDAGRVAAHGMLVRVAEEEFLAYWLSPYLNFRQLQRPDLDVTVDDLTGQVFLFQIGGPKSLEILEDAAHENLHDVKFLRTRLTEIAGEEVRILRIGMAGTLSYEIHGPIEVAQKVYQAIYDAGLPYGIRKLGVQAYMCNHTESGFGQAYHHMPLPWGTEDPALHQFMLAIGFDATANIRYTGSAGQDLARRYRSPYDLGWGHLVNFNHDFPGKAALEKEAAENRTTMVTLVWNADDIGDLFMSQFREDENYTPMPFPNDFSYQPGELNKGQVLRADKVLVNGEDVGTSSGRTFTEWTREMLSLATIDTRFAAEDTEVVVLWGDEGTPQKEIRARVARFPYLIDPVRNEHFDVSTIPSTYPPHE
ncbi:aminomethyltransferase family protein [Okibacterium endophyticum]